MINALPALLARELAALFPDDAEREVSAPVRINVRMSIGELLALAGEGFGEEAIQSAPALKAIGERIARAARSAVDLDEIVDPAPAESPSFEARAVAEDDEPGSESGQGFSPRGAVLQTLMSWQAAGVLELRLAAFSNAALEAWHRRAISGVEPFDSQSTSREAIDNLVDQVSRPYLSSLRDRQQVLRLRLIALAEAMTKLRIRAITPRLLAAMNRALPEVLDGEVETERGDLGNGRAIESASASSDRQSDSHGLGSLGPPSRVRVNRGRRRVTDCRVASALPFLLLGPLSRIGYLKTLAATMEAADCRDDLPLFASALAYKVLEPPARGWLRNPAMSMTASAFAALGEPVEEPGLAAFARRISPHLSPLDCVISGALIAGHDPRQPILLHRTGGGADEGLLLVDVEGCFPISWSSSPDGLRQSLIQLDSSAVLIPQAAAGTGLLSWMGAEGFRFIAEGAPTRGERWRVLRHAERRWSSNDEMTPEAALVRMARAMQPTDEDAETLWRSLAVERPSIPLADDVTLDRHITLAASVALGTIAWELWRHREQTAPHLALERFHDLDARVSYSRDSVRVSLPLGRRFEDLRDHGLLDNVFDAPWLDGRALIFSV